MNRSAQHMPMLNGSIASVALLVVFLAAWQWGPGLLHIPPFIVPPLSMVAEEFGRAWSGNHLLLHTAVTAAEVLAGFILGSLLGACVGYLLGMSPTAEFALSPYILALQIAPKVAFAPLFILWMGFTVYPKILVAILIVFFPVMVNVLTAVRTVDPDLINLARAFKATRAQIFWKIEFPASLPPMFAGLRIASTLAVVGVVVGELVGGNRGLGYLLTLGEGQANTPMVFVSIVMLTVVGGIAYLAVILVERRAAALFAGTERWRTFAMKAEGINRYDAEPHGKRSQRAPSRRPIISTRVSIVLPSVRRMWAPSLTSRASRRWRKPPSADARPRFGCASRHSDRDQRTSSIRTTCRPSMARRSTRAQIPASDAACVAMLRRAGAIILGKTVTPEFAAVTPGRTANPHNIKHTPGGSSSGSAAAVADFMVPVGDRNADCRIDNQAGLLLRRCRLHAVASDLARARRQGAGRIARQSRHPDTLGCRRVRWWRMRSSAATRCTPSRRRPLPASAFVPRRIGRKRRNRPAKSWRTRSHYCAKPVRL